MALTLLLAAAIALPACGGDDAPSKEDFVDEADALCAATNDEGTKLAEQAFSDPAKPTGPEAKAFIAKAVPLQRELLADLRELEPPEGDEDAIDAWLDAADEGTSRIEKAGETPEDALGLLQSDANPLEEAEQLSQDYGFEDCAS